MAVNSRSPKSEASFVLGVRLFLFSHATDIMAWCVKGKYYDLSKFNHPGGPIALNLARGRDADALIREYHPFTEAKVRAILEKYAVEKAETGMYARLLFWAMSNLFHRLDYCYG